MTGIVNPVQTLKVTGNEQSISFTALDGHHCKVNVRKFQLSINDVLLLRQLSFLFVLS